MFGDRPRFPMRLGRRLRRGLALVFASVLLGSCGYAEKPHVTDAPPLPTNEPIATTIQEIAAGKFKSAVGKQGHGGVLVRVGSLRVLKIAPNADGDLHV